jgi:hypothetical protein
MPWRKVQKYFQASILRRCTPSYEIRIGKRVAIAVIKLVAQGGARHIQRYAAGCS